MKIGLVGLYYENNKGDPLMTYCTEQLYSEIAVETKQEIQYSHIDLFGRISADKQITTKNVGVLALKVIKRLMPESYAKESLRNYIFKIDKTQYKYLKEYYIKKLENVDLIVVVGGALIKYQLIRDFHNPMSTLINVAEELNIPVYLQAMGIENPYDEKNPSCKIVKRYLNSSAIKMITTRDDIDKLHQYIDVDNNKIVGLTSDTAVWCPEIFHLDRTEFNDEIGIGVIDPIRFEEYGQEISAIEYEKWIYQFCKLLDEQGVKWKIFTNGHIQDYQFACKLIQHLEVDGQILESRPEDFKDLVLSISKFRLVVSSRLHACIIAYGFGKQVIGIDWNDKDIFFGKLIGKPEHCFKPADVTPMEAVLKTVRALEEHYDKDEWNWYREKIKEYIRLSIVLINKRETNYE